MAQDETSDTGLVLPGSGAAPAGGEHEGAEDGLEVSDHQSTEIREIFGTAFPQYLQPVEEILEQILSGKGDKEAVEALHGMLSSLENASARMGFDPIHRVLVDLHTQINTLAGNLGTAPSSKMREEILGQLLELKDMAESMRGDAAPAQEALGQTLFSALKDREEVGELVLRRLSSAGVITVEQLRQGRPEEVAAVSGLDLKVVKRLQRMVAEEPVDTGPAPGPELEALHQQVLEKLKGEVELEAALEDLAAELRVLRARVSSRREELRALQDNLLEKKKFLRELGGRQEELGSFLDELRLKRDALVRKIKDSEEILSRKDALRRALQEEMRAIESRKTDLCQAVDGLVSTLGKVHRSMKG